VDDGHELYVDDGQASNRTLPAEREILLPQVKRRSRIILMLPILKRLQFSNTGKETNLFLLLVKVFLPILFSIKI
jgi:hypothetical protein